MPLNELKTITIIFDECESIEDRCDGYREELVETITEILALERQHLVQGTNIQQKISDKCNAAGDFLTKNRGVTKTTKGDIQ